MVPHENIEKYRKFARNVKRFIGTERKRTEHPEPHRTLPEYRHMTLLKPEYTMTPLKRLKPRREIGRVYHYTGNGRYAEVSYREGTNGIFDRKEKAFNKVKTLHEGVFYLKAAA
jgi:hypothetical protein